MSKAPNSEKRNIRLRSMVSLLNDENENIRAQILYELKNFDRDLELKIIELGIDLTNLQKSSLKPLFKKNRQAELLIATRKINYSTTNPIKLETFFQLISNYLNGPSFLIKVKETLASLAAEYNNSYHHKSEESLAKFLFQDKKITGSNSNYYEFSQNDLLCAILEKKGLPITLTCIYMLVARQIGLKIDGCNLPGHFMATYKKYGIKYFVDCYNQGKIISDSDFYEKFPNSVKKIKEIVKKSPNDEVIIRRVIRNLIHFSQKISNESEVHFFVKLLKFFNRPSVSSSYMTATKFKPTDIIIHKKYKYIGIVVEVDNLCKANDDWYYKNKTQPQKEQPWYHILVHGSAQTTYVAQSNIKQLEKKQEIIHPLLNYFFKEDQNKRYIRTARKWRTNDDENF